MSFRFLSVPVKKRTDFAVDLRTSLIRLFRTVLHHKPLDLMASSRVLIHTTSITSGQ